LTLITIKYKVGMIHSSHELDRLVTHHICPDSLADDLADLLSQPSTLALKGTYGMREGAIPTEYDHVVIESDRGITEFEVYNKGVSMIFETSESLIQAFKICLGLQKML